MCDYGRGKRLSANQVQFLMESAWSESTAPIFELLLGSCGSILDEDEIPKDVLDEILNFVVAHPVPVLIFETHYTTVTPDVLAYIQKKLSGSVDDIVLELGLESSDPNVLQNSLNKYMCLEELKEKIVLIKSFGMSVVLNVFLGAPFLSTAQQLSDTLQTIYWASENGADRIVVFPANIKKNTLMGYLYQKGRYNRPSAWLLVELLKQIPVDITEKIELSWYGDRQDNGIAANALPPEACPVCHGNLQRFFKAYTATNSVSEKTHLLQNILIQSANCDCYTRMLGDIDASPKIGHDNLQTLIDEFELKGAKML